MAQNYYDGIASGYNQLYGDEQNIKLQAIKELLKKHNIVPKGKLLDVGCGTGISTDFFVDHYECEAYGIDPSEKLIEQNNYHKSNLQVAPAEQLPFKDNEFNIIVSVSAIQNFTDIQTAFDEMKRVAKPKSYFVLTFMSKGNKNSTKIDKLIDQKFKILDKTTAKNDTVYLCTE